MPNISDYKLLAFTDNVQELPNRPSLTAPQLKAWFDAAPEELRGKYNDMLDYLLANYPTTANITTDRKLSATGDFTGTLNGYPIVAAEPGLSSTVAGHTAQLAEQTQQITENIKGHTVASEIGATRNIAQQTYTYPTRILNPTLPNAPQVRDIPNKGIDIIAHWYNDFGLEKTAASATQSNGSYVWYDWSWNFMNNANYDQSRHPMLGWYAGDDAKTQDWQCYWLASSGVNVVIPANYVADTTTWNNSSDASYWQYVLFNQVKNFKSLKYISWLKYDGTAGDATAKTACNNQHNDVINNIIDKFRNVYTYNLNGKKYATVFVWDSETMRGVYDNYSGSSQTQAHYQSLATSVKALGFDGICIMLRNFGGADGTIWTQSQLDTMRNNGVIMLRATYDGRYGTDASYSNLYSNYASGVSFPTTVDTVVNVMTASKTQAPHPSGWNLAGSTPDLFRQLLQKAVDHVATHNMPKMVTIYNVSEWAEGGPGLQPNKQDGFGYLDAVKSVNVSQKENMNYPVLSQDIRKTVLINSNEWTVLKLNNQTVPTGTNQFDMGFLNYNFNDSASDYVFYASLDFPATNTDYKTNWYVNVNFSSSRLYVTTVNGSGTSISGVGISVMIRKVM